MVQARHIAQLLALGILAGRPLPAAQNAPPPSNTALIAAASRVQPVTSTATYLGGRGADRAYAVSVDPAGNIYVAGETDSVDFPQTGRLDAVGPATDAFVVKLD